MKLKTQTNTWVMIVADANFDFNNKLECHLISETLLVTELYEWPNAKMLIQHNPIKWQNSKIWFKSVSILGNTITWELTAKIYFKTAKCNLLIVL